MDHGHMGGMASPSSMMHHKMMTHMTFFWGTNAEVLFSKWPGSSTGMYYVCLLFVFALAIIVEWLSHCRLIKAGSSTGMYYVCLLFVFALAVIVEWLSHCRLIKAGSSNVVCGLAQTFLHAIRVGLAYMVMLAVMSFNVGVFLVAVAGHTVGFLLFGSRVFKKPDPEDEKGSDLPPMSC